MKDSCIPVISRTKSVKVRLEDIITLKNDMRKLTVRTEESEYSMYGGLRNIEDMLDSRFVECEKGFYVNLEKIESMDSADFCVRLGGGTGFYLGRDNFIRLRQKFNAYLRELLPPYRSSDGGAGGNSAENVAEGNKKYNDY